MEIKNKMNFTKLILLVAVWGIFTTLFAFRPGDKVEGIDAKLKWVNSVPMPLGELSGKEREKTPELRAVVFFFCRAANSDATIAMLEQCRQVNAGKLLIAAITPDQAVEAEQFCRRHKEVRLRFAVDSERKLTPRFTEGNMLLPLAFLIDRDGQVLWSGEAVDLAEAAGSVFAGKNDVAVNRKISPMLDELQQWMRDGSEIHVANIAAKIFEIAPGQPTALRMRLFTLESRGRIEEAMQLVDTQIKAAPQLTRLYFTALDLMLRYPQLRGELPSLAERFVLTPASTAARCTFTDTLLVNFPGDIHAVESAQLILNHTPIPSALREKALLAQSRARFAYVTTNLDAAIAAQSEAVETLKKIPDANAAVAAQKYLDFFQQLKKIR